VYLPPPPQFCFYAVRVVSKEISRLVLPRNCLFYLAGNFLCIVLFAHCWVTWCLPRARPPYCLRHSLLLPGCHSNCRTQTPYCLQHARHNSEMPPNEYPITTHTWTWTKVGVLLNDKKLLIRIVRDIIWKYAMSKNYYSYQENKLNNTLIWYVKSLIRHCLKVWRQYVYLRFHKSPMVKQAFCLTWLYLPW
jgi:hypothetical protein